jgi:hypothetical protein
MQQFLMDNLLPMAQRREPQSISHILSEPGVEGLLRYYDTGLENMFKHFAASGDQLVKNRNMVKATCKAVRTFDDQVGLIQEAHVRCQQQHASSKNMAYVDFMKFSNDLGLVSRFAVT